MAHGTTVHHDGDRGIMQVREPAFVGKQLGAYDGRRNTDYLHGENHIPFEAVRAVHFGFLPKATQRPTMMAATL
jgi:hypothetical protein